MTNLRAGFKTPLHRSDWATKRFKYLFEKVQRPVESDDEVVTAFRDGTVTLRRNRRQEGFTFSEKEIGYQGVEPGDLVIHAMDGFAGAIGVSDSRGKASPVLTVLRPISDAYPQYWAYYLRNLAITGFIESLAKGIRERSTDFRWKDAGNLLVNFPDSQSQERIATFLDVNTGHIDQLIAQYGGREAAARSAPGSLLGLLAEKRAALITSAVTGQIEITNPQSEEELGKPLVGRQKENISENWAVK